MGVLTKSYNMRATLIENREIQERVADSRLLDVMDDFRALGKAYAEAGVNLGFEAEKPGERLSPLVLVVSNFQAVSGKPDAPKELTCTIEPVTVPALAVGPNSFDPAFRVRYDRVSSPGEGGSAGAAVYGIAMEDHIRKFTAEVEAAAGGLSEAQIKAIARSLRRPANEAPLPPETSRQTVKFLARLRQAF